MNQDNMNVHLQKSPYLIELIGIFEGNNLLCADIVIHIYNIFIGYEALDNDSIRQAVINYYENEELKKAVMFMDTLVIGMYQE